MGLGTPCTYDYSDYNHGCGQGIIVQCLLA